MKFNEKIKFTYGNEIKNYNVNVKGITLIALVITIIILMILVGVTINLTLGDNGLFNTAKEAINSQKIAEYKDRVEISRATVATNNLGEVAIDKLIEQMYKDKIVQQGQITKISENEAEMTTEEGYKYKITLDGVEYIDKKGDVTLQPPSVGTTESTTHTAKEIQYSWDELGKIAETISNNYLTITNDTAEVAVSINGKSDILGVGDTKKINGRIVRILGFNHDELSDKNAYEDGKEHTYAGISFEYVDFITDELDGFTSKKNGSGWEKSSVRATLNGKLYDEIKDEVKSIKSVVKSYYTSYKFTALGYTNDYLWLLSSSEIFKDGKNIGYAGYTKSGEGERYKYYKLVIDKYNETCTYLLKPSTVHEAELNVDEHTWWLRSIAGDYACDDYYACVGSYGTAGSQAYGTQYKKGYGIAPGFAI